MNEWVYFANASGVSLERTMRLACDHHWLTRTVHNKVGAAIANVTALQPADRLYLCYSESSSLYLLASGMLVSPRTVGRPPVGQTRSAVSLPVFAFWNGAMADLAGYLMDPYWDRFTGICFLPDTTPQNPGYIRRPTGNNAIWRLEDCLR